VERLAVVEKAAAQRAALEKAAAERKAAAKATVLKALAERVIAEKVAAEKVTAEKAAAEKAAAERVADVAAAERAAATRRLIRQTRSTYEPLELHEEEEEAAATVREEEKEAAASRKAVCVARRSPNIMGTPPHLRPTARISLAQDTIASRDPPQPQPTPPTLLAHDSSSSSPLRLRPTPPTLDPGPAWARSQGPGMGQAWASDQVEGACYLGPRWRPRGSLGRQVSRASHSVPVAVTPRHARPPATHVNATCVPATRHSATHDP